MYRSSKQRALASVSNDQPGLVRRELDFEPEWLDHRRWIAYAVILAVPFLLTLPLWICHLSTDPIWLVSGMVQNVKPGLIRGSSIGDPNVGWTSQALGHLAAQQWMQGKVPWWNSYSGIGLPLAGEMQPGAFFLPFVLLFLLHNGFLWLRIAMQLIAGFSTFALLRELRLGRLAALIGGILFELNGTFALTRGPDSFFCAAAFLPLLLLGIEQVSRREREKLGTLWIAVGLSFSLLAGFPEVAYIDGLLALLWFVCRLITVEARLRFALRAAWGVVLGLCLSAPLLVGFWSLVTNSAAFENHKVGMDGFTYVAIPIIFVPFIYGPDPGSLGPTIALAWSKTGGYAGILMYFFALVGLRTRKPRWLPLMLAAWVAVAWVKSFSIQPFSGLMNHIPFLTETVFYRYSAPSWELCLAILAAIAIDEMRSRTSGLHLFYLVAVLVLIGSICIAWPWRSGWHFQASQEAMLSKYFLLSVAWAGIALVSSGFVFLAWSGEKRRVALVAILALDACVLFTPPLLASVRPGSVDRAAVRFLQSKLGLYRFYTLDPIQPNYSAYFRVAGLDYVAFPAPQSFFRYVAKKIYPPLPKTASVGIFWPVWASPPGSGLKYLWENLPEYGRLGVKYIVARASGLESLTPQSVVPTAGEGNEPMPLQAGQQIRFRVSIPAAPPSAAQLIRGLSIFIGNYGGTADGSLDARVCMGKICSEGSRPLSASIDNSFFYILLSKPITAPPGTPVVITLRHNDATKPLALWLWPDLTGQDQDLQGPEGKPIPGKALRLAFSYRSNAGTLARVYHDSLIEIFEFPHPAPYYNIVSGGPCRLDAPERDSLDANCAASAVLIRRELYMPGWYGFVNGKRLKAKPYEEIFQSFDLPRGGSHLRFSYVPPNATLAAIGMLFAIVALAAEFAIGLKRRRRPAMKDVAT